MVTRNSRGGKDGTISTLKSTRRTAACGFGVLALALAALGLATLGGHATPATVDAAGTTLGIDVTTDGNSASQLGAIDSCKRVNTGDPFDVDLFVSDVSGLQGFDIYVGFDSSHLTLTAQDTGYMIGPYESFGDPLPDSDGNQYFGRGATVPVNGSGVLARLTFHANSAGIANIGIATTPARAILSGQHGPIGGANSNGYYDGAVANARVAIGQDCPSGPVPTDSAAPTPSPSPTMPGQTPPQTPGSSLTPTPTGTPPVTASPSPTPAPTSSQIIVGDADCSGIVALPDVLPALKFASKLGPSSACQDRTDTDCDGFITANDVLRILRYVTGDPIPQQTGCLRQIGSPVSG